MELSCIPIVAPYSILRDLHFTKFQQNITLRRAIKGIMANELIANKENRYFLGEIHQKASINKTKQGLFEEERAVQIDEEKRVKGK